MFVPTICLIAVFTLGSTSTLAEEGASRSWKLLHSFDGRDFITRGKVNLKVADGTAKISVENDESCLPKDAVKQMVVERSLYQLKLEDDKSTLLASVSSCQVRRSNFRDEITLTLNQSGDAVSLSYTPLVSPLAPTCQELELSNDQEPKSFLFDSKVSYETATAAMTIPVILPNTKPQVGLKFFPRQQGSQGLPGGNGDTNEPPQSFFRRYWYIILPLVLMSLFSGEDPPREGAQQQPGQAGAGAAHQAPPPTAAPGSAPKQRRGKRN